MYCLPLADDCGVSESNVEAIMRCIDAGALRGTSLMACGKAVETGANQLAARMAVNPELRAGVHLNLLEGHCSSNPGDVPLLVDEQGRFKHTLGTLYLRLLVLTGRARTAMIDQVTGEWLAQTAQVHQYLSKATGWKQVPLYLDGHQHVHAIPALLPALEAVTDTISTIHVRVPQELRYFCPAPLRLRAGGSLRRELLTHWSKNLRKHLLECHLPAPEYFIGAFCSGSMNLERLEAGLARVGSVATDDAVVEIMTHPGCVPCENVARPKSDGFTRFYAAPEREIETSMLMSPRFRQMLAKHDPTWHCFESGQSSTKAPHP